MLTLSVKQLTDLCNLMIHRDEVEARNVFSTLLHTLKFPDCPETQQLAEAIESKFHMEPDPR